MTDEELRKVYAEAVHAYSDENLGASGIDAGLRAVFLAGARAQREMEPTAEMCFAGGAAVAENGGEGTQHEQRGDALAAYRAMQRVAPLVGGEG